MTGPIVVYSPLLDWIYRVAAVAGWLGLWWWGRWAGRRGPMPLPWFAGWGLAAAATVRTVPVAPLLDRLTGLSWLSVLVAHLLALGAATVAVATQLSTLAPMTRSTRVVIGSVSVTVALGLVTTWFLAVMKGAIPTSAAIASGSAPVMIPPYWAAAVHQGLFAAAVLTASAIIGISTLLELAASPHGALRLILGLVVALSACATAWAAAQIAAVVTASTGGGVTADTLGIVDLMVLGPASALLVATGLTYRSSLSAPPPDVHGVLDDLAALRDRLSASEITAPRSDDLFGILIEIRDRMWMLQQRVSPHQLERSRRVSRAMGLVGSIGRAFTAAVALEVAMHSDPRLRPERPADIWCLGGGDDEASEALWLAQVQRVRMQYPVGIAAVWVLDGSP